MRPGFCLADRPRNMGLSAASANSSISMSRTVAATRATARLVPEAASHKRGREVVSEASTAAQEATAAHRPRGLSTSRSTKW